MRIDASVTSFLNTAFCSFKFWLSLSNFAPNSSLSLFFFSSLEKSKIRMIYTSFISRILDQERAFISIFISKLYSTYQQPFFSNLLLHFLTSYTFVENSFRFPWQHLAVIELQIKIYNELLQRNISDKGSNLPRILGLGEGWQNLCGGVKKFSIFWKICKN